MQIFLQWNFTFCSSWDSELTDSSLYCRLIIISSSNKCLDWKGGGQAKKRHHHHWPMTWVHCMLGRSPFLVAIGWDTLLLWRRLPCMRPVSCCCNVVKLHFYFLLTPKPPLHTFDRSFVEIVKLSIVLIAFPFLDIYCVFISPDWGSLMEEEEASCGR